MKNTLLLALMILAALPASAQKAANPNCSLNSETTTALAEEYAARVDGLLRNAHGCDMDRGQWWHTHARADTRVVQGAPTVLESAAGQRAAGQKLLREETPHQLLGALAVAKQKSVPGTSTIRESSSN